MTTDKYTFQKHKITNHERLWLKEVSYSNGNFNPRIARVKLHGQFPENFNPNKIDNRLYSNGQLGIIGLWHIEPQNPLFKAVDRTIHAIKQMIEAKPEREEFCSGEIENITSLDKDLIGKALYLIGSLGNFVDQASGPGSKKDSYDKIWVQRETTCGSYLHYKELDELLEKFYISREPTNEIFETAGFFNQINSNISTNSISTAQESIKKDNWKAIEKEYGVSKRGFGKKINFVSDKFKREIIFRDIEHAYILSAQGFSKPAIILAGGVIEELLRLYLKHKNISSKSDRFVDYINACKNQKLLKRGVSRLTDSVRDFRNLVHLGKEETKRHSITKATAKGSVASIFTLVSDFH